MKTKKYDEDFALKPTSEQELPSESRFVYCEPTLEDLKRLPPLKKPRDMTTSEYKRYKKMIQTAWYDEEHDDQDFSMWQSAMTQKAEAAIGDYLDQFFDGHPLEPRWRWMAIKKAAVEALAIEFDEEDVDERYKGDEDFVEWGYYTDEEELDELEAEEDGE